jgi:peptidoglycan hydrolase CwlO-like protein
LEEADHRNWEKGQEIDSLKASVAGLQSQVEVLSSVIAERDGDHKEKCNENIQLKARIQELEQQAKKGKSVRFAVGTK